MAYIAKLSNSGGVKSLNRYVSALAGNAAFEPTNFESIASVTVGAGGASTITFSSIPSTYQHLQIRALVRTNRAAAADTVYWRFNSDSGANYTLHSIYGNGTSALADAAANLSYGYYFDTTAASEASGIFSTGIIDILDYQDTNKFKTARTLHGKDMNGSGSVFLTSSLWRSTSAITSMTLQSQNGANISQYSSFALYGIRG